MTIPCNPITTNPDSLDSDLIQQESTAITSEEHSISILDSNSTAILRSISETCLNILEQTNSQTQIFIKTTNSNSPSDVLLTKQGILAKSSSLPTLSLHTSQSLSYSQHQHQQKLTHNSSSSSTPSHALAKNNSLSSRQIISSPYPESSDTPTAKTEVSLNLPKYVADHSGKPTYLLTPTQIKINRFNQQTIKKHHTESKNNSATTSKKTGQRSILTKSSPSLSPMAMFSHVQKEATESKFDAKLQDNKEEGEGQGEHQDSRDDQNQDSQQQKKKEVVSVHANKVSSISQNSPSTLPDEFIEFALSEAQLSSLVRMRVSNLDILRICAEIMKLMLRSREQDNLARMEARAKLSEQAKRLVDSYSNQALLSQWLGVSTAVLGIVGAAAPMIGEIAGNRILDFIKKTTGFWQTATVNTFFKGVSKICGSLSQLTDASSKIYELKETASRTFSENYKEIYRIEHDEITRSIEEIKDHWRNMDNFLLQILQTEHDAVRSLYQ